MSKKNSNLIFILISFVMIILLSVAARLMKIPDIITQISTIIGSFVGAYIVFSLTYELGKYIIAKIVGFKFISFRFFSSVRCLNEEGKTKGYTLKALFKVMELKMYKESNKTRKDAMIYCLGGSIFNFIFVVALILTASIMKDGNNIRSVLFIIAITGIFNIALNIIPMNSSTPNDGSYLKTIKESDKSLELFYTLMDYNKHLCNHKPTEFDFNKFVLEEDFDPSNPTHAYAYSNQVKYLIYKHEFQRAFNLIQENEMNLPLLIDDIMYDLRLKAIFLKTMLNNDAEALEDRDNLTGDSKDAAKAKTIDRAIENYAFFKFSNMDEYAAEEAYDQATKLLDKAPYAGLVKEQKDFLDFLKVYKFTK